MKLSLVFLPLLIVTLTTPSVFGQDTSCHKTNCKKTIGDLEVTYASFVKVTDAILNLWTASKTIFGISGTQEDRERQCAEACVKDGLSVCKSADLSYFSTSLTSTCRLFAEDAYNHTDAINIRQASSGYTVFHVKNSFCQSLPCNTGVCQPNFETDGGYCKCSGYSGQFCQTLDPLAMEGVGHWTFDTCAMLNVGTGASSLGDGTKSAGVIIEVPDRSTMVMQCKGSGIGSPNENCFEAPTWSSTCFTQTPWCPSGFTFAFWLRMLKPLDADYATGSFRVINQGYRSESGFIIAFLGHEIYLNFDTATHYYSCRLDSHKEQLWTEWNFIGMTHEVGAASPYSCFFNDQPLTATSNSLSNTDDGPFTFGGTTPFFVDDVIYLPSHLKGDGLKVVYNQTKH